MEWKSNYEKWINFAALDIELKKQLEADANNPQLLEDYFYKQLEFGTGGMRGEIGPGTNRLNIYTIRKATEGLARLIKSHGEKAKKRGVVVAYDSRHKSSEFALEVAKVLGVHGITTYLFESLRATPILSFAVRYLNASSGIVLTASHNPPEYNGYKVYGEDGGQLPPRDADVLVQYVNQVGDELLIDVLDVDTLKNQRLLQMIGDEVDEAYLSALSRIHLQPKLMKMHGKMLSIVFSPLHGTSNVMIQRGLDRLGFRNVTVVKEQAMPDPNFSTVKSPNPEEHEAFELAIEYGKQVDADILLATDPDADRLGVAVKNPEGNYVVLTGNQTGAILLEYLLSQKQKKGIIPKNGVILKTIVTSELGREIANAYGLLTLDTLTGFKFIGERIFEFERTNEYHFQFGYEESYGYLIGDFVRDKDAIQTAIFACEVALYYKKQGKNLYDGLMEIFEKYGYFSEGLHAITLKGIDGAKQIQDLMMYFRKNPPSEVAGINIQAIEDYQSGWRINLKGKSEKRLSLPESNVLKYYLEDESWFCLRPSGTEPKIKFYYGVKGESFLDGRKRIHEMKEDLDRQVSTILKDFSEKH